MQTNTIIDFSRLKNPLAKTVSNLQKGPLKSVLLL